jgi:hypothetical protein
MLTLLNKPPNCAFSLALAAASASFSLLISTFRGEEF